jgi:hypothetical protein
MRTMESLMRYAAAAAAVSAVRWALCPRCVLPLLCAVY